MAKCIECNYSTPCGNMRYKCTKKGRTFDYATSDPDACSSFRPSNDGFPSCYECDYFTDGFFGQRCKKKDKKVNEDDRACSHFCG